MRRWRWLAPPLAFLVLAGLVVVVRAGAVAASTLSTVTTGPVDLVPGSNTLNAVACPTVDVCVEVGSVGTGSAYHAAVVTTFDGLPGPVQQIPGVHELDGVACPTTRTCLAVGGFGQGFLVTITDGIAGPPVGLPNAELFAITCASATTCLAVGDRYGGGLVVTITNGVPTTYDAVAGDFVFDSVACRSVTACEAVGYSYAGPGPSFQGIAAGVSDGIPGPPQVIPGTGTLHGVACPSPTTCEAVGETTDVSATPPPYGAVVTIANTGAYSVDALVTAPLQAVACPTAATCDAVSSAGEILPVTDGAPGDGAPGDPQFGRIRFSGVACPSALGCLAVGSEDVRQPLREGATVALVYPGAAPLTYPTNAQRMIENGGPFTWSAFPGAQAYILVVGTTRFGTNLVNSGVLAPTQLSYPMPNLPTGRTLYATLLTKIDGAFRTFSEATFTVGPPRAEFTYPLDGQVNVKGPGLVDWTTAPGAQHYILVIGTTTFGTDLVNSGLLQPTTDLFIIGAPLPSGRLLYATLLTENSGQWTYQAIAFTVS